MKFVVNILLIYIFLAVLVPELYFSCEIISLWYLGSITIVTSLSILFQTLHYLAFFLNSLREVSNFGLYSHLKIVEQSNRPKSSNSYIFTLVPIATSTAKLPAIPGQTDDYSNTTSKSQLGDIFVHTPSPQNNGRVHSRKFLPDYNDSNSNKPPETHDADLGSPSTHVYNDPHLHVQPPSCPVTLRKFTQVNTRCNAARSIQSTQTSELPFGHELPPERPHSYATYSKEITLRSNETQESSQLQEIAELETPAELIRTTTAPFRPRMSKKIRKVVLPGMKLSLDLKKQLKAQEQEHAKKLQELEQESARKYTEMESSLLNAKRECELEGLNRLRSQREEAAERYNESESTSKDVEWEREVLELIRSFSLLYIRSKDLVPKHRVFPEFPAKFKEKAVNIVVGSETNVPQRTSNFSTNRDTAVNVECGESAQSVDAKTNPVEATETTAMNKDVRKFSANVVSTDGVSSSSIPSSHAIQQPLNIPTASQNAIENEPPVVQSFSSISDNGQGVDTSRAVPNISLRLSRTDSPQPSSKNILSEANRENLSAISNSGEVPIAKDQNPLTQSQSLYISTRSNHLPQHFSFSFSITDTTTAKSTTLKPEPSTDLKPSAAHSVSNTDQNGLRGKEPASQSAVHLDQKEQTMPREDSGVYFDEGSATTSSAQETDRNSVFGEYDESIFENMRKQELDTQPNPGCISLQSKITPFHRCRLVNWLANVHSANEAHIDSFHLAVNLIDRVLSAQNVSLDSFELLGIAALPAKIIKVEGLILRITKFKLLNPGPIYFVKRLLTVDARGLSAEKKRLIEQVANYLCELSLVEEELIGCKQSLLAAGAIYSALKIVGDGKIWSPEHSSLSQNDEEEVIDCSGDLLIAATKFRNYSSTLKKYASVENCQASVRVQEYLHERGFREVN
ncbi:G2/mitotic-specific cyclin [Nowakowskiella sp. JEL0407]|nr:G2/mitotic-specific cyclin [Nowakowskiella sp. JEL0407]